MLFDSSMTTVEVCDLLSFLQLVF